MPITFEICRDARLLEQYYVLREQCFRGELGIPDFDGSEDDTDREGQILVAVQDHQCIGGARISPHLVIGSELHDLDLPIQACCMWERFALDPAVRSIEFAREFCAQLIAFSRRAGFEFALVLSSLRNARFYRQCHSALGVGFRIHRNVPHYAQGTFAELEHYLSVAHLQDGVELKLAA